MIANGLIFVWLCKENYLVNRSSTGIIPGILDMIISRRVFCRFAITSALPLIMLMHCLTDIDVTSFLDLDFLLYAHINNIYFKFLNNRRHLDVGAYAPT